MLKMRRSSALLLLVVFPLSPSLALAQSAAKTPAGYTKATADANAAYEKVLLDTPTPENARRYCAGARPVRRLNPRRKNDGSS